MSIRLATVSHINMDGMGVLSFFNSVVPKDVIGLLKKNNLSIKDIKLFIFHQASKLALEELRRNINIPPEKMLMDLEETGNLVSSSIPIALARVMKKISLRLATWSFLVALVWVYLGEVY